MKRMHVPVAVGDLEKAVAFYSTLFAAAPVRVAAVPCCEGARS
jgi:predicted enzyme related to lactoylglutathione lyase